MWPPLPSASRVILGTLVLAGLTTPAPAHRPNRPPNRSSAPPGSTIPWTTNVPLPQYGAAISGWVKLEDGRPAVGFTVHADLAAWPDGGGGPNAAVTDGHGWYRINASPELRMNYSGPGLNPNGPNGYLVWVSNGGKPYVEPSPQTIDTDALPKHRATHVDFVLRSGPEITARAQDAVTGAPVPGVTIFYQNSVTTTAGITGADGVLRFRIPYTRFWLRSSAPGHPSSLGDEREFTAVPGQEVTWDLKIYR